MAQDQRRLAAILAVDVAGYSRLMAADEAGTLALLRRLRAEVIDPKVTAYQGRTGRHAEHAGHQTDAERRRGPDRSRLSA